MKVNNTYLVLAEVRSKPCVLGAEPCDLTAEPRLLGLERYLLPVRMVSATCDTSS